MKILFFILLFILSFLNAIELDSNYIKSLIKQNPSDTHYRAILANYYIQNRDFVQARKYIEEIYTIDPNNKRGLALATKLYNLKHHIYVSPDIPTKNIVKKTTIDDKLYELYTKQNRPDLAISFLKNMIKKYPTNQILRFKLARLYYWDKNLDKAYKTLKPISSYNSQTKSLYANLAYEKGNYYDAVKYLPYALKLEKKPEDRYITIKRLGFSYLYTNRTTQAKKVFEKLLQYNPSDTLVRYNLASIYEKEKDYKHSIYNYKKILNYKNSKEYYLAKYHYAYSLMQLQKDAQWLEARRVLQSLDRELYSSNDESLKNYTKSLLKVASGDIVKPTYYKDIVLTEGSKKILLRSDVFVDIDYHPNQKPVFKKVVNKEEQLSTYLSSEYVSDGYQTYNSYEVGADNIYVANGIRYSTSVESFSFKDDDSLQKGSGLNLELQNETFTFGLGFKKFDDFSIIAPSLTWNNSFDNHNLSVMLLHTNGAFVSYQKSMVENQTNVTHISLTDKISTNTDEDAEVYISSNIYDDENTNLNLFVSYPFWQIKSSSLTHTFFISESMESNSKTDVPYTPLKKYDQTYLTYKPKIKFESGFLEASLGGGYSVENKENIYNLGLKSSLNINHDYKFELNCQKYKSSYSSDDFNSCNMNFLKRW